MAGVDIRLVVEDVAAQLALGYDRIQLQRANSVGGTFSTITTQTLVAGTYYYTINDPTGDINKWYRYKFEDVSGTPASDYSDPFRVDAVTRLRIRQGVLDKYGVGLVFSAMAGGSVTHVLTNDSRLVSAADRANKFKGLWLLANTGANNAGQSRIISATAQVAADIDMTFNPALADATANGDEFELHNLADPSVLNNAINRGLARYWYVDRVPIPGVANQEEYSLSGIPWLQNPELVFDLRYYPHRANGVDDGVDVSWTGNGRWWRVKQDGGSLVLSISPSVDSTTQFWLETIRPMPPLYTDTAALPQTCNTELAIALAYDELLAFLSRPGNGTIEERKSWYQERVAHMPELRRLLRRYRPQPRFGPAQMAQPVSSGRPFVSR